MRNNCSTQIAAASGPSKSQHLLVLTDGFLAWRGGAASSDLAPLVREVFSMMEYGI